MEDLHSEAFVNLMANISVAAMLVGKRRAMKLLRHHVKWHRNAACGAFTKREVHAMKLVVRAVDRRLGRKPYERAV